MKYLKAIEEIFPTQDYSQQSVRAVLNHGLVILLYNLSAAHVKFKYILCNLLVSELTAGKESYSTVTLEMVLWSRVKRRVLHQPHIFPYQSPEISGVWLTGELSHPERGKLGSNRDMILHSWSNWIRHSLAMFPPYVLVISTFSNSFPRGKES